MSLYRYCFNDSLSLLDPYGLKKYGESRTWKEWRQGWKNWAGSMVGYAPTPRAPAVGVIGTVTGGLEAIPAVINLRDQREAQKALWNDVMNDDAWGRYNENCERQMRR